jgi:hypothetical protein
LLEAFVRLDVEEVVEFHECELASEFKRIDIEDVAGFGGEVKEQLRGCRLIVFGEDGFGWWLGFWDALRYNLSKNISRLEVRYL